MVSGDLERSDLLRTLAQHRGFLLRTVQGLTDEQARLRPTVSQLCLGGIVKHVSTVESGWCEFARVGPSAIGAMDEAAQAAHAAGFEMGPGESLEALCDGYREVAARTDELVATAPSLDETHPLPSAPWFEPGARWSVRMAILHVIAETSQHAGHADILRETIDGAQTMG
jgi:hypothetical protein